MRSLFLFLFACSAIQFNGFAQGCVAVRGMGSCNHSSGNPTLNKGEFLVGMNYRYFESFRHFRGRHEETYRIEEGTNVINKSHFGDLSVSYAFNKRLFASAIIPFVYHTRSSMYEHGGNPPNGLGERHTTSSSGLADIRLTAGYWLFNPEKNAKFNLAPAIGIKLPSGKADYTDTFYNQGENRDETRESVVDQSIQPGDGGYGIISEIQGFLLLGQSVLVSTNLFYMFGVQETNGVLTRNGRSEFSCPDQYAARMGFFVLNDALGGLNPYLGSRIEGVPSSDVIGGSAGYRRPGYAFSIEPGVSFVKNKLSLELTVPIALIRSRTQSFFDKERTLSSGTFTNGDAAFADYLININLAYRFIGSKLHE